MTRIITAVPLTAEAFAPFGNVIETEGAVERVINNGNCTRYHDLARVEAHGPNARVLVNIFRAGGYSFPLKLKHVERHPFGSQAFMPLSGRPFLVVVSREGDAGPGRPNAFITAPGQGVNYARNMWHGVLTPIGEAQDFLVVDRGGDGSNLEEFVFDEPWTIELPKG